MPRRRVDEHDRSGLSLSAAEIIVLRAKGQCFPGRPIPELLEAKALTLIRRALGYGEQGRFAAEDFGTGVACPGLESYTWRERYERLALDLIELESGQPVFGTTRDFGMGSMRDVRAAVTDAIRVEGI